MSSHRERLLDRRAFLKIARVAILLMIALSTLAPQTLQAQGPVTPTAAPVVSTRGKVRLSIATGGTGGINYVYGGGLASLISKNIPNVDANAEVTAASVDNMKLLQAGKADLTFSYTDVLYDAYLGQGAFKETGKVPARSLAVLFATLSHVVVSDESGIKTLADLRGKRVSVGAAGSGTEVLAKRLLEAVGIDPDTDFRRERLGVAESANAMKDKKLDAFFWGGGLPTAAILDLAATPGQKIHLLPNVEALDAMVKKYGPLYSKVTIPKPYTPAWTPM